MAYRKLTAMLGACLLYACTGLDGQSVSAHGLSTDYPLDDGMAAEDAVLFHDDFETGWGRWDRPVQNTRTLFIDEVPGLAHSGNRMLRSTVTRSDLDERQYISSKAVYTLPLRSDRLYLRFYARFKDTAPGPHHWIRIEAGTDSYNSMGKAGIRPWGDEGFHFSLDINNRDLLSFYVYWHKMRSGRCNDGSTTPGCAGDQGNTYFYGNVFRPPAQQPLARNRWHCIEIMALANTPGKSDGALALWVNDALIGDYRPGHPEGTWLRARFHTGGCRFDACTEPVPFEGFDFRTTADVGFKRVYLDAYYQRDTFARRKAAMERRGLDVADEQTIYYDDVVIADRRIGCMNKGE